MDERVLQARVGIVVVSALLLTAILIVLFGDAPVFFKPGRTIYVKFPSAPGIMEGTPVRKSGILIGRVQKVDFAQGSSDVIVTLQIDEGRELWDHEICRITSDSLLGDKALEFAPSGGSIGKKLIQGGDASKPLTGIARSEPLEVLSSLEGDLRDTLQSMTGAGNEVRRLANRINAAFGQTDEVGQSRRSADERQQGDDTGQRRFETRRTARETAAKSRTVAAGHSGDSGNHEGRPPSRDPRGSEPAKS